MANLCNKLKAMIDVMGDPEWSLESFDFKDGTAVDDYATTLVASSTAVLCAFHHNNSDLSLVEERDRDLEVKTCDAHHLADERISARQAAPDIEPHSQQRNHQEDKCDEHDDLDDLDESDDNDASTHQAISEHTSHSGAELLRPSASNETTGTESHVGRINRHRQSTFKRLQDEQGPPDEDTSSLSDSCESLSDPSELSDRDGENHTWSEETEQMIDSEFQNLRFLLTKSTHTFY